MQARWVTTAGVLPAGQAALLTSDERINCEYQIAQLETSTRPTSLAEFTPVRGRRRRTLQHPSRIFTFYPCWLVSDIQLALNRLHRLV
jgi:hypothetical protein